VRWLECSRGFGRDVGFFGVGVGAGGVKAGLG
jgi:hypothetical protein